MLKFDYIDEMYKKVPVTIYDDNKIRNFIKWAKENNYNLKEALENRYFKDEETNGRCTDYDYYPLKVYANEYCYVIGCFNYRLLDIIRDSLGLKEE